MCSPSRSTTAGPRESGVTVHLDTDAGEDAVAELRAKVAATSPVGQTLSQAILVEISPA